MKYLKDIVDEKLHIKDAVETTNSFSHKYMSKAAPRIQLTKKFKQFFEDLGGLAGLQVQILEKGRTDIGYKLKYVIRSEEPDETGYSSYSLPTTYKSVLHKLFSPSEWNVRTSDVLNDIDQRGATWFLGLGNLDTSDISDLKKIGFLACDEEEDIIGTKGKYNENKFVDNNSYKTFIYVLEKFREDDTQVFISFPDLYSNINKIYKEFFE